MPFLILNSISLLLILGFLHSHVIRAEEVNSPTDDGLDDLKSLSVEELLEVPIVFGASKHDQKVTDAPSSVSIMTREQIKKFGYRDLGDILRGVRGFYTSNDRSYSYTGIRGFNRPGDYGGRILLLVDGHRINDPLYDTAAVGSEFILTIDMIERVEIIRGAGSALYGNNAFFAIINVISRKGRDVDGVEVAGRTGSFGTYEGRASYGKRYKNGLEVIFSGSRYASDGQEQLYFKEYDQKETNDGIAENLDGGSNYRLFGSVAYGDFTLKGAFVSREKTVPTAAYETLFNSPHSIVVDDRQFVELGYQHQFAYDIDVKARLYHDRYSYYGTYPYDSGNGSSLLLNIDDDTAEWWGGELQINKTLFDSHRLTAGVEYRHEYNLTHQNYDRTPFALYDIVDSSNRNYSFYIQDEYDIFPQVKLNAGVRYDHFGFFGGTINPRLAAIYNPLEKTTVKLLYGSAFRAPNVYERGYRSISNKDNPNLQPETIDSYEIIWEQYLSNNLRFSLGGFYNQIDGLISQRLDPTDGLLYYDNTSNIKTSGFDVELEAKSDSGWLGRASYTWQNSQDQEKGISLTNSPTHLVKFNLSAPVYQDKLFASLELQYTSRVRTLADNTEDGFLLTNLNFYSQQIVPGLDKLELSAGIFNLFDEKYAIPGAEEHHQDVIQQDGRNFNLSLRYRF